MRTWEPTCDNPPNDVNYVSGADLRGTLDIVWSSLLILILCTWAVLHLNVPIQVRPSKFREQVWRTLFLARRKLNWCIISVIAPEVTLGMAAIDRWSAAYSKERMNSYSLRDGVDWGTRHGFLANMGGWCLKFEQNLAVPKRSIGERSVMAKELPKFLDVTEEADKVRRAATMPNFVFRTTLPEIVSRPVTPKEQSESRSVKTKEPQKASKLQKFLTKIATKIAPPQMTNNPAEQLMLPPEFDLQEPIFLFKNSVSSLGDVSWRQDDHLTAIAQRVRIPESDVPYLYSKGWFESVAILQTDTWPLDAEQLYLCREMGLIDKLPDVSEEDIEDQSKSDFFVKAFAAIQLFWFCIQLIGRVAERIAITQLEIAILAFAICSSLSYLLLLEKPKDVMNPRYLVATRYPTPEEMHLIASSGPFLYAGRRRVHGVPDNSLHRIAESADQLVIFGVTSALSASLFGAIHLLAWNFHFPTIVELWLWRLGSLCIIILPPCVIGLNILLLEAFMMPRKIKVFGLTIGVNELVMMICTAVFTVCRVFIFVEMFRTLAFLEPSAYATTWSVNMPQFS